MTRKGMHEYAAALRPRYQSGSRKAKAAMLAEFCQTTGYHRKAAIRLLCHCPVGPDSTKRGNRQRYDPEVVPALRQVWEAADGICSKRLAPFLARFVAVLEQHGELELRVQRLNPVQMLVQIRRLLSELWELARNSSTNRPADEEPKEGAESPVADAQASRT